jgi:hypothetical protein
MDGAELVFGDPVRPAKIVGLGTFGGVIVLRRVAEISEYIVNLFLGKNAFRHLNIYRTSANILHLR